MITYRAIKKTEIQLAMDFCKENGLEFPIPFDVAFAAFDEDKIVGICALKKMYQIEPLINTTSHAGVAQVLAEKTMAVASVLTDSVFALVKDRDTSDLFERYGFTLRDKNIFYIEKEL
jgi:hypothetical protein